MFDSIPLLIETATLVAAAYFSGCIVGFILRRLVVAVSLKPVPVTVAVPASIPPTKRPLPEPTPAPAEEFANVANMRTTPAQRLAATIEAERQAKVDADAKAETEARKIEDEAKSKAPAAPVQEPAVADAADVAPLEPSVAPHYSSFGKPAGLAAPRGGHKDNLKLIKGIGPRVEKALNDLGVFHFDQIAAWDRKTVVWVETHFSFKGRIAREKWLEQAQELARSASRSLRSVKA